MSFASMRDVRASDCYRSSPNRHLLNPRVAQSGCNFCKQMQRQKLAHLYGTDGCLTLSSNALLLTKPPIECRRTGEQGLGLSLMIQKSPMWAPATSSSLRQSSPSCARLRLGYYIRRYAHQPDHACTTRAFADYCLSLLSCQVLMSGEMIFFPTAYTRACVAGVISAYKDASIIIQKIKKKRAANRAALPSTLLEESVDQAPEDIEREKQRGIARFGQDFERGDEIAIIALQGVTIELQRRLLEKLRDAAYDDEVQDFMHLVDVTDVQRDRTVATLYALKQRLLQAKPIVEVAQITSQSRAVPPNTSDHQDPTDATDPSSGAHHQSTFRRLTKVATPSEAQGPPQPAGNKSRRNTIFEALKTKRAKGSSKVEEPEVELESQDDPSKRASIVSPPNTSPPPNYKYHDWEDDPQQIWGRSSTSIDRAASDPAVSNAAVARIVSPTNDRAVGKSPVVATPTPDNNYLGFCKSAWRLQNGDRKAMQKSKEFNDGWSQSSVYYLKCAAKCAFAGHMDLEKIWGKLKVTGNVYAYQCVFCVFQGHKSPVLHGTDLYLEHIHKEHCGQLLGEVVLHMTKCVTGRIADDDEDFDINLGPLDDKDFPSGSQSQLASDNPPGIQPDGFGPASTSSAGIDSTNQVCTSEPWNRGLSEFHWGGELGRTELE
nr:hypothetical protein CFP56_19302 [Quercus suber]